MTRLQTLSTVVCLLLLATTSCTAFTLVRPKTCGHCASTTSLYEQNDNQSESSSKNKNPFGFLTPYESKIPDELRDEIYKAEGNTAAAQDRGQRVALYAAIAFAGILAAFFNGFLTELRANGPDGSGVDLAEAGFGWVMDNFLFSFLFTNKIGGGICLLGGGAAGLLAEAELDTKRINAEKIYEELERRRGAKTNKKRTNSSSGAGGRKKRRSGKEKKRLSALSEVVLEDKPAVPTSTESQEGEAPPIVEKSSTPAKEEAKEDEKKGILDQVKDFYGKADAMAASQALLLNKKLEDSGVVDKITDETGLKVIGKEEASKLAEGRKKSKGKD